MERPDEFIENNKDVIEEANDTGKLKRISNAIKDGWNSEVDKISNYFRTHGPLRGIFKAITAVVSFAISIPIMALRLSFAPIQYEDAKVNDDETKAEKESDEQKKGEKKQEQGEKEAVCKEISPQFGRQMQIDVTKLNDLDYINGIKDGAVADALKEYQIDPKFGIGEDGKPVFTGEYIVNHLEANQYGRMGWESTNLNDRDLMKMAIAAEINCMKEIGELKLEKGFVAGKDNVVKLGDLSYGDLSVMKNIETGELYLQSESQIVSITDTNIDDLYDWVYKEANFEAGGRDDNFFEDIQKQYIVPFHNERQSYLEQKEQELQQEAQEEAAPEIEGSNEQPDIEPEETDNVQKDAEQINDEQEKASNDFDDFMKDVIDNPEVDIDNIFGGQEEAQDFGEETQSDFIDEQAPDVDDDFSL